MSPKIKHLLIYGVLPVVVFVSLLTATGVVYAQSYNGKIFPGISIGPVDVGGLTHEEAAAKLSALTSDVIRSGLVLTAPNGTVATISLTAEGVDNPDASYDFITWDIDEAVSAALSIGRSTNPLIATVIPISARMTHPTVPFLPIMDSAGLEAEISLAFPELSVPAVDAGFLITKNEDGWKIDVSPSSSGSVILMSSIFEPMEASLAKELFIPSIAIEVTDDEPAVTVEVAKAQASQAQTILEEGPYTVQYGKDANAKTIQLTATEIAPYLIPTTDEVRASDAFLDLIRTKGVEASVIIEPQDARLAMENGRVVEFVGSQTGIQVDEETVSLAIEEFFEYILGGEQGPLIVPLIVVEPSVTTADVNNLGIGEVLGVGTSDFSGSPSNRIKNIKNGARLLNGILIAPDEEFSLLSKLGPFTTENGYLPELVIKGDEIKPEVGGGLCQIGTTTFRAAMHSGLPITERRNHSLVVRYYNDPSNGNPGTDATIYDPSPDFKFVNDTGHWILFEAEVDMETMQLFFTFWGTSDGRVGSYTPPVVSNWIGIPEKRVIETTDLAPGVEKCQGSHIGANASFTYTIARPDGTNEEQIFTSAYRPLPEICLVGVEKLTEEETPSEETVPTEEVSTEDEIAPVAEEESAPAEG